MNHFYISSYQNDEVECWEKPSGDDPPDITSHGGTAEGTGSRLSSQVSGVLRVLHPAPPGITLITSIIFVNSFVKYFSCCPLTACRQLTEALEPPLGEWSGDGGPLTGGWSHSEQRQKAGSSHTSSRNWCPPHICTYLHISIKLSTYLHEQEVGNSEESLIEN